MGVLPHFGHAFRYSPLESSLAKILPPPFATYDVARRGRESSSLLCRPREVVSTHKIGSFLLGGGRKRESAWPPSAPIWVSFFFCLLLRGVGQAREASRLSPNRWERSITGVLIRGGLFAKHPRRPSKLARCVDTNSRLLRLLYKYLIGLAQIFDCRSPAGWWESC